MIYFLHAASVAQTENFSYIAWKDLVRLCSVLPVTVFKTAKEAKNKSAVIASHDAINKRKEQAIAHDNFTLLRLDLDDTELDIEGIKAQLKALNIESYIIHTTAKHQQLDDVTGECYGNRYRVYIKLEAPLNYKDWSVIETYLSHVFNADDCATRPQQIMYLPTRFTGIKYDYVIGDSGANNITSLLTKANEHHEKEAKEYTLTIQNLSAMPSKKHKPERLVGKQISLIETVNDAYEWGSLLRHYGYKQQGKKWLPPESKSGVAGVVILTGTDNKERYYSHHSDDPCRIQGHSLDKFDFLRIREYGGDNKNALRGLGKIFIEVTKFNQKEFAIHKSNDAAKQIMGAYNG